MVLHTHTHVYAKATLISVTLSIQRSGRAREAAEKYLEMWQKSTWRLPLYLRCAVKGKSKK